MSQDDLAGACEIDGWKVPRELISTYEGGKSPTPQSLAAIAKALGLTRAEMRALVRTPTLDAATTNGGADEEDDADRRTASKILTLGGLSAAWAPLDVRERIAQHNERPVDLRLIAAHEDLADRLASLHYTLRPNVLGDQVARHADKLLELLVRPMSDGDRRRLNKVAVGSHAQVGLLAFASGDRPEARRYLALARDLAEDSKDDMLKAQAVGVSSILRSSMPAGGRGVSAMPRTCYAGPMFMRNGLTTKPDHGWDGGWLRSWLQAAIRVGSSRPSILRSG